MHRPAPDPSSRTAAYRLVVAGPVGDRWAEWFGADSVVSASDTTEIVVRVADQAELFGRLRRVQDLNLQLLELALLASARTDLPPDGGSANERT
jgi:hypothetical protein